MKTIEDYLALPEGTRVELIDGAFYDMAETSVVNTYFATEIWSAYKSFIKSVDLNFFRNIRYNKLLDPCFKTSGSFFIKNPVSFVYFYL